jgi:ribonuclease HI
MINYQIFTDGSCRGNKNGGVGIVWLKNGEKVFEYSKGYKNTTNNQMELLAIGKALASIKKPIDSLEIVSDSEYALGCIFNLKWNPKKNVELINRIRQQVITTQQLVKDPITYTHTRGHQKDDSLYTEINNLCDKLAQNASKMILE